MRAQAQQTCPEFANTPSPDAITACFRSASRNTMFGDLPPSSSCTFFRFERLDISRMRRPVSVLPVKESLRISGCSASAAPTVGPSPVTTCSSPGGSTSRSSWHRYSALSGVFSDVLRMIAFPHASAGAAFQAMNMSG